jgi:3-carboxy-cis,cis-muconate cycloisomerase
VPAGSGLFDAVSRRGPVPGLVSDVAYLQAMLDTEAALARAQARAGLFPADHADASAEACDAGGFDIAEIGRAAAAAGNPVVPLVQLLRAAVGGAAGGYVHAGATSQDILDTAMMLIAKRALDLILADLDRLEQGCARLAARHRETVMAGRTLLQQAVPITFGLKAAGWLLGVREAAEQLAELRQRRLAVQLGGAAGTLASLGNAGPGVVSALARALGLVEPPLPWHSDRTRVAQLGAALAVAAGAAGKISLDIVLLAQTEVAEVSEGTPGASTAMPHKRNPVAAIEARASLQGALAQAGVLLGSMGAEHERGAGSWQAEWHAVGEALRLTSGAVARTLTAVDGLQVDEARMRSNLQPGEVGVGQAAALVDRALAIHKQGRRTR